MSEFMDVFSDVPNGEVVNDLQNQAVNDAMAEVSRTAGLDADDTSWLEELFQKIVSPVTEFLDITKPGYDTEVLTPNEGTQVQDYGITEYNLDEATQEWHVQDGDFSCAVCSQQFIINEFLDLNVTEAELCQVAESYGWFDPEIGTYPQDCDNLLELYGIDTQINEAGTILDLKQTLDEGGRVIVSVDSSVLWTEGYGNFPVFGADHAIEVIGLDESDPDNVKVIVNDSGIPDGCGKSIPLDEFLEAWAPGGGFMISAYPND